MKIKTLLVFFILIVSGCGYKPTAYYAKNAIQGKTFVDIILNIEDSSSSSYIKDEINKMVLNKFNATLTPIKEHADSVILINLKSISHNALETNNIGYVKTYRTTVSGTVSYKNGHNDFKTVNVTDYYDYSVELNSVLTTAKKNEAVKIASMKAISNLFSKIAVKNIKN